MDLNEIINELNRGHATFSAFEKGKEIAETLTTLSQGASEAETKATEAKAERVKQEKLLSDVKAEITALKIASKKELEDTKTEAADLLKKAKEKAQAEADASKVLKDEADKALTEVNEKVSAAATKQADLEKSYSDLEALIASKKLELKNLFSNI